MTRLEILRTAKSLSDVAFILGVTPKGLAYTIRIQPLANRYSSFTIPKKTGGSRNIDAPEVGLKLVQSRLADVLQDCISDIDKERGYPEKISHGFRRGHSIITNARNHSNRRFVLNVDIADFFQAINFGRVLGYFLKNRDFCLDKNAAVTLAQIACHNNGLPQGAPSSPVISNLITHILDIRLAKIAKNYGCYYTRYADDLTFSTNLRDFPEKLARLDSVSGKWIVGRSLEKAITQSGFALNVSKTRVQLKQSRQDVTGIVVNDGVNVRREYYKNARAYCAELFKTGKFYINVKDIDENGQVSLKKIDGTRQQLKGILSFIDQVKSHRPKITLEKTTPDRKGVKGFNLLYKRFFYFDAFFANDKPMILCEGKTDNIYIQSAVAAMFSKFPTLSGEKNGKADFKFKFFNYTKTSLKIIGIGGGTGQLNALISNYKSNVGDFKYKGEKHPVIIVIDNDSGSSSIYKTMKTILNIDVKGDKPFYFMGENLYIVPTPRGVNGEETMIESFLPQKWIDYKLNGKKFNMNNKGLDTKTEIGKALFAEYVVKKFKKDISFDNFSPLLDNITSAINDYYAMVAIKP